DCEIGKLPFCELCRVLATGIVLRNFSALSFYLERVYHLYLLHWGNEKRICANFVRISRDVPKTSLRRETVLLIRLLLPSIVNLAVLKTVI
ncbi:MAG: hypothetical protein K2X63_10385, partial [Burkholderiaceae bacterium]|nr:hypothetical protein [Burkholderiaceae bacterium]